MSSVTTSKIDTKDGVTNLTLTTGNTTGAAIVIDTSNTIVLRSNSTFNTLTASATTFRSNVAATFTNTVSVTGAVTLSNTITVSGNATFSDFVNLNSVATFTANIIATNVYSGFVSTTNATVTSNTLNIGTPALSTTGWSRMPNGLLWQWGSVASTSTTGDITFPTAFSTLYSVTATTVSTVSGSTYAATLLAANTTTANVRTSNTTSRTVYWQAIGV